MLGLDLVDQLQKDLSFLIVDPKRNKIEDTLFIKDLEKLNLEKLNLEKEIKRLDDEIIINNDQIKLLEEKLRIANEKFLNQGGTFAELKVFNEENKTKKEIELNTIRNQLKN